MNYKERLEEIDKILEQVNPLNYNRILLETKLYSGERNPNKNEDEIQEIKNEIQEIHNQLNPLFKRLRQLQCHYEIEFQGELSRVDGTTYWNNPESRVFHLRTCCQLDSFAKTWGPYINDPCVNNLLLEVHQVILQQFYSNFKILNIKRL